MKKIIIFLLTIVYTSAFLMGAYTEQQVIISRQTRDIMGATHERVQRELSVSGSTILQTYHYIGADFNQAAFRIITGDDYTSSGYRPATTLKHAQNSQALYDDYVIIGGVNADFFESYGVPQEAYVENGQVISSGIGYANREVIGFKDNGEFVFGKPQFEGYEVVVVDASGKQRIRLPLKDINKAYTSSNTDIYAYFDTYNTVLPEGVSKYVAAVEETKGAVPKIFGRGLITGVNIEQSMVVEDGTIVLVSQNIYLKNLVQIDDRIYVQRKMIGDFTDVKWAVGVYGKLVSDGQKVSNIIGIDPNLRHPRTAIGVKDDGSVFFIAMDGRQPGYSQGATLYELADLMLSYGAVTAYNFDGGGSTTFVLRQDNQSFAIENRPSDGSPRAVTNSVFLALRVNFDNETPHQVPDYSTKLNQPTNIQVTKGLLSFSKINDAKSYEIMINNQTYQTSTTTLDLKLIIKSEGTYEISIKAKGDGLFFSDSEISSTYLFEYDGPVELSAPSLFAVSSAMILSWDNNPQASGYLFIIGDKSYQIFINRFNLTTLNLKPGTYEFEVIAQGDNFNTSNSKSTVYNYRVYSDEEKAVMAHISIILELLYQRNRK